MFDLPTITNFTFVLFHKNGIIKGFIYIYIRIKVFPFIYILKSVSTSLIFVKHQTKMYDAKYILTYIFLHKSGYTEMN